MATEADDRRTDDELIARLVEAIGLARSLQPRLVNRHEAARILGYGSVDTFDREVACRKAEGFPQPVDALTRHPVWAVADLDAWVERLRRRPRRRKT